MLPSPSPSEQPNPLLQLFCLASDATDPRKAAVSFGGSEAWTQAMNAEEPMQVKQAEDEQGPFGS